MAIGSSTRYTKKDWTVNNMSLINTTAEQGGFVAPLVPKSNKVSSVQTLVHRGSGTKHRDFCHDFLIHHETDQFFIGAVMDGCTGGIHSQFASALFGKVFNFILRVNKRLDGIRGPQEPRETAKYLMHEFCQKLCQIKYDLGLAHDELLSTILLAVYSKPLDKLFIIGFGDGYVHVNGKGYRIDNSRYGDVEVDGVLLEGKNMPDYLIADVDRIFEKYTEWSNSPMDWSDQTDGDRQEWADMEMETWNQFSEWISKQPTFEFEDVHDFSIATDGIYTFRCGKEDFTDKVIELLLDRKTGYGGAGSETPHKKMNVISFRNRDGESHPDKLNAVNEDDISFIRVMVDKEVE